MQLDTIDQNLIRYLQEDCKKTTKELSMRLKLSVTAVYERIKKLEKSGIIEKYIAIIDKEKIDKSFMVFCQIKLIQHKSEYVNKFENDVIKFNEVLECYNISGDYDYILKVIVKNMKAYRKFINDKLTTLDYISSAHSTFIINELKNSLEISL